MISFSGSLSLCQRNLRKFLLLSLTIKQWNICWMLAVMVTTSLQKHMMTPNRLFLRSGPESRRLFKDTPSSWPLQSKTTCIWFAFLGWYTPNVGKYQHSLSCINGGASSACTLSNIFCMNEKKLSFISGFLSIVLWSWSSHYVFLNSKAVGTCVEEWSMSTFQYICVEGVNCYWFVGFSQTNLAKYNPSPVESLGIRWVIGTINLFPDLVDS